MIQVPTGQIPGYYHRRIGDIVVTALSDGYLDGTVEVLQNITGDDARGLLDAQFRDIKRVAYVFGVHEQMDLPVHGNGHLCGYDIVLGILVVCGIQAIEVRVGLADLIRVQGAEGAIRTGIAEIKCKLSCLRLNLHRIR